MKVVKAATLLIMTVGGLLVLSSSARAQFGDLQDQPLPRLPSQTEVLANSKVLNWSIVKSSNGQPQVMTINGVATTSSTTPIGATSS